MSVFKDQMQREVHIKAHPQKIISLVPSQTELLFDLGLANKIIGITKFCIHPKEQCNQKAKIGGTKKFNFEKIESLSPDLIIGNKEENYKAGIDHLSQKYPIWMSDISTLEQSFEMILALGDITGTLPKAQDLVQKIKQGFASLNTLQQNLPKKTVAYFIWRKPYMLAGGGTFINHMLETCGWDNIYASTPRYPEISEDELKRISPDYIFLSSEPFPFQEKHTEEFRMLFPKSKICLVDGEMFSWPGSRLQYSADYMRLLKENLEKER